MFRWVHICVGCDRVLGTHGVLREVEPAMKGAPKVMGHGSCVCVQDRITQLSSLFL